MALLMSLNLMAFAILGIKSRKFQTVNLFKIATSPFYFNIMFFSKKLFTFSKIKKKIEENGKWH